MAQVVHADQRQGGVVGEVVQVAEHVFVSEWLAVAAGEDQTLVAEGAAGDQTLTELTIALSAQSNTVTGPRPAASWMVTKLAMCRAAGVGQWRALGAELGAAGVAAAAAAVDPASVRVPAHDRGPFARLAPPRVISRIDEPAPGATTSRQQRGSAQVRARALDAPVGLESEGGVEPKPHRDALR